MMGNTEEIQAEQDTKRLKVSAAQASEQGSQKDNSHVAQRLIDQLQQLQDLQQLHSKAAVKPQAVQLRDSGLNAEASQRRAKRAAEQQARIAAQMCAEIDVFTSQQACFSNPTPLLLCSTPARKAPPQRPNPSEPQPMLAPTEPSRHTSQNGSKPASCAPCNLKPTVHLNPARASPRAGTCKFADCAKPPAPEADGEESSPYCPAHRDQIMFGYLSKGCLHPGCINQPFYPKVGGRLPNYCDTHKPLGMPSLNNARCQFQGCLIRPSFAVEGSGKPKFCFAHKDPWMVDTSNKTKDCQAPGCTVTPSFAHSGKARFCASHKEPGMKNVAHKPCREPGCLTRPSFAAEGVPQPEFCATHKLPGMVHVRNQRDAMKQIMAVREARQAAGQPLG